MRNALARVPASSPCDTWKLAVKDQNSHAVQRSFSHARARLRPIYYCADRDCDKPNDAGSYNRREHAGDEAKQSLASDLSW